MPKYQTHLHNTCFYIKLIYVTLAFIRQTKIFVFHIVLLPSYLNFLLVTSKFCLPTLDHQKGNFEQNQSVISDIFFLAIETQNTHFFLGLIITKTVYRSAICNIWL